MTHQITIDQPGAGAHQMTLSGSVRHRPTRPPADVDLWAVNVLVRGNDNTWHLQAPPSVEGDSDADWSGTVTLGGPSSTGEFTIVAVTGARLTEATYPGPALPAIPNATFSAPVTLTRS